MPIGNGKNVVNVKVTLKSQDLVTKSAYLSKLDESDVAVGNRKYSKSAYSKGNSEYKDVIDFVRHQAITNKENVINVTTREEKGSSLYDIYSVAMPPKHISDGLDKLYGAAIIDIMKTIPDSVKGRNISLKTFGVLEDLTDERIKELRTLSLMQGDRDFSEFEDIINTLNFLKLFNFEIMNDSIVSKEILEYQLEILKPTSTDVYRKLKKYYQTALDNENIYRKLVYLYRTIYDKPYNLIHKATKEKDKMKTKES